MYSTFLCFLLHKKYITSNYEINYFRYLGFQSHHKRLRLIYQAHCHSQPLSDGGAVT